MASIFYKFSSTFLNSSALYINFATFNIACFDFDIIKLSNLFMFGQWQKYGLKKFLLDSAKRGHTSKKWYSFSIFDILQHLQILSAEIINLGPVVQSIVSLRSSLRGQLVKCFTTL